MMRRWCLLIVFVGVFFSLFACDEVATQAPTNVPPIMNEPTSVPVPVEPSIPKPMLNIIKDGFCFSGPGVNYTAQNLLVPNQYFEIISIDDEATWLQIDPNALIDPEPPTSPLNTVVDPDPPSSTRCWVPSDAVKISGDLYGVPVFQMPRLGVVKETYCYTGPGSTYYSVITLNPNQFFDIIAIDDEVTWTSNESAQIDEEVTWLQIDPNAVIDPEPPTSPLTESSNSCPAFFQTTPRCWVADNNVKTDGDLSIVPVIQKPVLKVIDEATCFSGPGETFNLTSVLNPDEFYEIMGIDDEVTWVVNADSQIDDEVTWIDDEVTWFQINPNSVINPDPPTSPPNELSPQPDPPGSQNILRCWVSGTSADTSGDLHLVPIILKPNLLVVEKTYCYVGPGPTFKAAGSLNLNQFFRILGVDGDVAKIDDEVTWFQIDPSVLVNPFPPYSSLLEIIEPDPPSSTTSLRCWVPGNRVQTCGDLSILPIIRAPSIILPTFSPTITQTPEEEPSVKCSDFKTPNECGYFGSNMGCLWEDKIGCYKKP